MQSPRFGGRTTVDGSLLCAWWRAVPELRQFGEPPAVVFVCQDSHDREELMRLADTQVTGCLASPGDAAANWRYPGRERMLFVTERDVHDGSLSARMLDRQARAGTTEEARGEREVELPRLADRSEDKGLDCREAGAASA